MIWCTRLPDINTNQPHLSEREKKSASNAASNDQKELVFPVRDHVLINR